MRARKHMHKQYIHSQIYSTAHIHTHYTQKNRYKNNYYNKLNQCKNTTRRRRTQKSNIRSRILACARARKYIHTQYTQTNILNHTNTHTHITQKTGTKYDVTSCKTNQKKIEGVQNSAKKNYLQQYRKKTDTNAQKQV